MRGSSNTEQKQIDDINTKISQMYKYTNYGIQSLSLTEGVFFVGTESPNVPSGYEIDNIVLASANSTYFSMEFEINPTTFKIKIMPYATFALTGNLKIKWKKS